MQVSFKIEKGKPVPERSIRAKYPFDQMEVGDSIFVQLRGEKDNLMKLQTSVNGNSRDWALRKKNDHKFVTKQEGKGVRIWRIK